ncbi:MAG TPA: peptidase domain-containing ABC transporter [Allosphingosinicella sp.]|jgi:ATP-binding cassette subfamily B protein RaxB
MTTIDPFTLLSRRRVRTIRQAETAECGLACLAMVANFHGHEWTLPSLRMAHPISGRGATIRVLVAVAAEMGFDAAAGCIDAADVGKLELPAIIHLDNKHFVVVERTDRKGGAHVHDPALGAYRISRAGLEKRFSGYVIQMSALDGFARPAAQPQLSLRNFWFSAHGLKRTLAQVAVMSLVIQLLLLTLPLFIKFAVDGIPAADNRMLLAAMAGFLGLALFHFFMSWFRDLFLLWVGTSFSFELVTKLFRHLVHLELSWFERRSVGDVVSKFQSTQPISDLLTKTFIATLLDGIMACLTLVVTYLYGGAIVLIPVGAVLITILVRLAALPAMKARSLDSIQLSALESSTFMETARGIATLKAFGEETNRARIWRGQKAAANNALIRFLSLKVVLDDLIAFTTNAERVIFIFAGVVLVQKGVLTLGLLFALQAYKTQFVEALERFTMAIVDYRMLDVHLGRLSDVALTESKTYPVTSSLRDVRGEIQLQNVGFSYDRFQKPVLDGVNLRVGAGETVAITGPSGGGKSTLVKIVLGLLEPTTGGLSIDGNIMDRAAFAQIRPFLASVLQDDVLYGGSLAQNITFFDEAMDEDRLREAARAAAVLSEIEAMPLKFNTLVGDMGSTLSGGQKQRVLLARALYRSPRLLIMDEGTAHLDALTERMVNESIRSLKITRLIIAHRYETVASADRVFFLSNGQLEEVCHEDFSRRLTA